MKLKKFLLITPTYRRPYMLRSCIMDAMNQDYKNFFHSIVIYQDNTNYDYTLVYNDLISNCLDKDGSSNIQIGYQTKGNQHDNYINTIKQAGYTAGDIDYIVKWDDDDIHKADYLSTINSVIDLNPGYNIYSFKLKTQLNNYHLKHGDYHNLGGFPERAGMPNTLVFDKLAIKAILSLSAGPGFEDTAWVNHCNEIGLTFFLGKTDSLIWHIHGGNISTGDWLEP